MKLKQGLWIVVADGARATVFVNEGTAFEPHLQTVRTYAQDNPKTSDQGRDKPPRTFDSGSVDRRSAFETPDLHQRAEDRFVDSIMVELAKDAAANAFEHVVDTQQRGARGHLENPRRLGLDLFAYQRMEALAGGEIYLDTQALLEQSLGRHQIQRIEPSARVIIDKNIHVAFGAGLVASG